MHTFISCPTRCLFLVPCNNFSLSGVLRVDEAYIQVHCVLVYETCLRNHHHVFNSPSDDSSHVIVIVIWTCKKLCRLNGLHVGVITRYTDRFNWEICRPGVQCNVNLKEWIKETNVLTTSRFVWNDLQNMETWNDLQNMETEAPLPPKKRKTITS